MKKQGIILNGKQGDLGVLTISNVEKQNQAMITYMFAGELKEYPTLGVGIANMLLGNNTLLFKHKIREQLEADGFEVAYLDIKKDSVGKTNIELNAKY